MGRLDRYLALHMARYVALATVVLVALFVLVTLGDELNKLNARYGTAEAFWVALAQMPRWLFELFPSALLIGLVAATSVLLGRSEWVAMHACGYGLGRQAAMTAVLAFVAALLVLGLFDRVGPSAQALVVQIKGVKEKGALVAGDGVWVRDGDWFRYFRGLAPAHVDWVEAYQVKGQRLIAYVRMTDVSQVAPGRWRAAQWLRWRWEDGGLHREGPYSRWVDLRVDDRLMELAGRGVSQMDLSALRTAIDSLRRHGLDARRYEVRYYGMWLYPLYGVNLALLGLLLTARKRVGRGGMTPHIALGLLVGIVAYLFTQAVDYALVLYRWDVLEGKLAFQLALLAVNGVLFLSLRRIAARNRDCRPR